MDFKNWLELHEGHLLDNFKRWYDDARGSWADVERVAQKYPQVKDFLARIDKELAYGHYDRFADPLQRFIEKLIPGHSKYHNVKDLPIRVNATAVTKSMPVRHQPQQANSANAQQPSTNGMSQQVTSILQSFESRLSRLEKLLAANGNVASTSDIPAARS